MDGQTSTSARHIAAVPVGDITQMGNPEGYRIAGLFHRNALQDMDSFFFDAPLAIMMVAIAPMVLLMWIGLMAALGEMIWSDCYRLSRPHDIVKAVIIGQKLVNARISVGKTTMVTLKPVYRLRYEYEQRTYEVEHLVLNQEHVELNEQAGTFLLYVPKANPADATPESPNAASPFAAIMLMIMGYLIWEAAPTLLTGY